MIIQRGSYMVGTRRFVMMFVAVAIAVIALISAAGPQSAAAQGAASAAEGVPSFLQVNKRYAVRWQPGDVETYRVLEIKEGWVRAESQTKDAPTRMVLWLNPRQAITIQEVQ